MNNFPISEQAFRNIYYDKQAFRKFESFHDHNGYIAPWKQLFFDIFLKAKKLLLLDQLFTYNINFDAVAHFV